MVHGAPLSCSRIFVYNLPCSLPAHLRIHPEVADAVASARPVVALETAILTHGMPYPHNLEWVQASMWDVLFPPAMPLLLLVHSKPPPPPNAELLRKWRGLSGRRELSLPLLPCWTEWYMWVSLARPISLIWEVFTMLCVCVCRWLYMVLDPHSQLRLYTYNALNTHRIDTVRGSAAGRLFEQQRLQDIPERPALHHKPRQTDKRTLIYN